MAPDLEADFQRIVEAKRRGGVALEVGVSRSVWLGGLAEERAHEPLVFVGPRDAEGDEERTYFADRAALEAWIGALRRAADDAWGQPDDR